MADLTIYSNLFPQVREYALISVAELENVIETGLPLNREALTRSKKRAFAGWLPMLRVLLAAIQEGTFIGPDWMNPYELRMVHFPEAGIPNLPEPPTFSNDDMTEQMQTDEFDEEEFDMLPLAQSTPRHSSSDEPPRWSQINSSIDESSMMISFADSTIEDSITIEMNDFIETMLDQSSPRSFEKEVLEFTYTSGYSTHRSDLLSPTSPPTEWIEETMEIFQAD